MTDEPTLADAKPTDGWLIHKSGRGWYRPNAEGYTTHPAEAGRYSLADAMAYSYPNGLCGPRDGLTIKHESELPPPPADDKDATIARLTAELEISNAASWYNYNRLQQAEVKQVRLLELRRELLTTLKKERKLYRKAVERAEKAEAKLAEVTAERDNWRNDCLDANASELSLRQRAEQAEAALAQAHDAGFREGVEAAAKEWQNVRVEGGVAVAAVMAYSDRIRALAPQSVDVRDTPTQAQQAGLSDAGEQP